MRSHVVADLFRRVEMQQVFWVGRRSQGNGKTPRLPGGCPATQSESRIAKRICTKRRHLLNKAIRKTLRRPLYRCWMMAYMGQQKDMFAFG
jgi:hypothetical protein